MKTGIIYCPRHEGLKSSNKRWKKIAQALSNHDIDYDLIQSESAQSVERLVTMMIHNGYDNIILAGGDSALNDAANCLMREERSVRNRVCIGVIPNGNMNDFASFWGFNADDYDHVAESIKKRRTRKVDVGILQYTDKNDNAQTRYFLNCVNVGLLAGIQSLRHKTRKLFYSRKISFFISFLLLAFQRMEYKLRYSINFETEQHRITNLCVGNALGYGLTPNAVPYNGTLDITVIKPAPLTHLMTGIGLFIRGKFLNHKGLIPYRCREIEITAQKGTPISVDGRSIPVSHNNTTLHVNVAEEEILFLIER